MGFGTSAAAAIIFAGAIVLIGITANVAFSITQDLKDAALDISDMEFDRQRTRVNIINTSYNSTSIFLNATNTGEVMINAAYLDILVNGTLETQSIAFGTIAGVSTVLWGVHEVLYLELNYSGANNWTRIRLITHNGVSGTKVMR